ncbi:MAG: ABC transporter permease subunit [Clostridiales bacterium]|nr:ABC transporter permease subunit [Clostridiales bacterium]
MKKRTEKKEKKEKKKLTKNLIRTNISLYLMMAPVLILIIIFCYVPMYGIVIAFQDYFPGNPFIGEGVKWVGLKYFKRFVQSEYFFRLLRNSIVLSLYNLIFGFTAPIAFAILMDQIKALKFKKLVQTASYMPYFISTVVVAGMVISFVDKDGLISNALSVLGLPNQNWRIIPQAFPVIYTVTNVWKGFGFGSILYFSTISSIDQGLYESAKIDGANRWQQVTNITLPGLKRIIMIQLIMAVGSVLSSNTELILLLYNANIYEVSDVIGTYSYRLGIVGGQYSYTAAAGLFMSVIAFTLTFIANKVSNRVTGYGLW